MLNQFVALFLRCAEQTACSGSDIRSAELT